MPNLSIRGYKMNPNHDLNLGEDLHNIQQLFGIDYNIYNYRILVEKTMDFGEYTTFTINRFSKYYVRRIEEVHMCTTLIAFH